MEFPIGVEVYMLLGNVRVGKGIVFRNLAADKCHSVPLGSSNIALNVMEYFTDVKLPIPFFGITMLSETVGTFVAWKKVDLQFDVMTRDECSSPSSLSKKGERNSFSSASEDLNSISIGLTDEILLSPQIADSTEVVRDASFFASRANWTLKEATLMNPCIPDQALAKGMINIHMAHQFVNESRLGEARVGVVLDDVLYKYQPDIVAKFFPGFKEDQPYMVAWDLVNVVIPSVGLWLSDMYKGADSVVKPGVPLHMSQTIPIGLALGKAKNHYNFVKRKARSDAKKLEILHAKKRHKHVQDSVITNVATKKCCNNECCRKATCVGITTARGEYYGLDTSQCGTFILDKLWYQSPCLVRNDQMLFDGQIVCKMAFYKLYSFGKTLFYDYQKRYKNGGKVGFHWGKGQLKPTKRMSTAVASLRIILESTLEPQPHLAYSGTCGTDDKQYKLPACYTKDYVLDELNTTLESKGFKKILSSSFYKAWKKNFANFSIYKQSAFAKCSECNLLRECLAGERKTDKREETFAQCKAHVVLSSSRRIQYYANRSLASIFPQKYLSMIYDKMDQAKTGLPRLWELTKDFANNCRPLPIALTGMLVHGRDSGAFGHFSVTGLWPCDPNFTITSLAKCLHDLENWAGNYNGDLSIPSGNNIEHPLLGALMDSTPFKTGYLPAINKNLEYFVNVDVSNNHVHSEGSFTPLPRHLLLQMDNSGKDNKNKHVFGFCSELVARGVFETIQVSFLMVGHTHKDIDALFSQVSKTLCQQEVSNLHQLMAMFWGCQQTRPVPSLITEVADYKSYSKAYMNTMKGHFAPISFCFSMRDNVPIFQYKEHLTSPWLPLAGQLVWKTLPSGQLKPVPISSSLQNQNDIINLVEKFIAAKVKNAGDVTSTAFAMLPALKSYWESILQILKTGFSTQLDGSSCGSANTTSMSNCPSFQSAELLHGFWPRTNHGTGCKSDGAQAEEDLPLLLQEQEVAIAEADEIWVGDPKDRLCKTFDPLGDIKPNEMIIICPSDEFDDISQDAVWLCRALSTIDMKMDSEHFEKFEAEWWRPVYNKGSKVSDLIRYKNCLSSCRQWKRDPEHLPTHIHGQAAIYSWTPKVGAMQKGTLKFPPKCIKIVRAHLKEAVENIGV